MKGTKTYKSLFIVIFFIVMESFFGYTLIQNIFYIKQDKMNFRIAVIVISVFMFLALELLFIVYARITINREIIVFSKPIRRFSLFGGYRSKQYHTLKSEEWNELHFYHGHRGRGILCFFNDEKLVFYANLLDGESYARTISQKYLDKKVETKDDSSILRSLEKKIKKESPDRIIY